MPFRLFVFAVTCLAVLSCHRKGCTNPDAYNYDERAKKDDGSCLLPPSSQVTLTFNHSFDAQAVNASLFEDLIYVNAYGTTLSITKLKYHISDVRFFNSSGDSVVVDGYHFIDISQTGTLSYVLPESILQNTYTGVGFNLGFTPADNQSGSYAELNAANWGWPEMLGGGYHQLQLEGRYIASTSDTNAYALHSGSSIRQIAGTDTSFHENYLYFNLPFNAVNFGTAVTLELNVNVAEWFKNPVTWDLNTLSNGLMENYDAQIQMHQNGKDIFSVGSIVQ
ncbi:MAG: hypothetical protein HYZ14_17485 [Bacteroidetes bacterium]|nr:hypothetical protein [Bacteroidota bacterium]